MNEAHNSTKQGLNEVIEYLERDKKELLQDMVMKKIGLSLRGESFKFKCF